MPKLLLTFLIYFISLIATAQRYPFVNYTTRNGLVQSNIMDIKQDISGNIWIGTQGGISVFDGRTFTNYDDREVLQSLSINSILCDSTGLVWVATANGLLRYDHQFTTVFQPKDSMQPRTSSLVSYGNMIYFICNSRIYRIAPDHSISPVIINGKLEKTAQFISFDVKGNMWAITNDQKVFSVRGKVVSEYLKPEFIDRLYSNSFGFIRINGNTDGQPYFVSNFGTFYVSGDSLRWFQYKYPKFFDLAMSSATFVFKDNDSVVWVGSTRCLVKLINYDSAIRFDKQNGFGDHSVSTIMRDRENNLWIGSTYYGVYKLSNEALFNVRPAPDAEFKNISYSVTTGHEQAFVGTWGSGPFVMRNKVLTPLHYANTDINKAPALLYTSAACRVGTITYTGSLGEGLWKVDDGSDELKRVPLKERDAPINNIIHYHDKFILQAQDGSTFLYDDRFQLIRASDTAMSMIRMVKDRLYMIVSNGRIDQVDSNFNTTARNLFPEVQSEITEMLPYRGQTIISTIGQGIFIYDHAGKLLSRLHKKNGLNSNVINCLLLEKDILYAGSNYGLLGIDMQTARVRIFNENEGMFNSECRKQGLLRLSDDAIMIATTNGLYLYYHGRDNTARLAKGYVQIKALTAGGSERTVYPFSAERQQIALPGKIPFAQNEISISFKGVSQRASESLEYHYRLSGAPDSSWKIVHDDAPVEFHQLPPGKYLFTVYVAVKGYVSPVTSVAFTISRPLQGEWWFQLLVLTALAIFVVVFLNFLNKLYQKYIQTKTIDDFGRTVKRKNNQLLQLLDDARQRMTSIKQMRYEHQHFNSDDLHFLYVNAELSRMRDLVRLDSITLKDFHDYFDEVMVMPGRPEKKIYQEIFDPALVVPMDKGFSLMEIFSLYMTWKLTENPHYLFSLTSEVRSNNRLVIRCYPLNALHILLPSPLEAGFRRLVKKMKDDHWSVAFIENPGTSSMLIVELEI